MEDDSILGHHLQQYRSLKHLVLDVHEEYIKWVYGTIDDMMVRF